MKDKAAARAATTATAVATQSNSDFDHHPPETAECEKDTFSESKINNDTESSKNNIAELQRQLLNKLSKTEKSPGQRQKDTFAEFMKEVTYTFPPAMWLKFQSEVNSLMQKYQYELHQESSMQTQRQQQDSFIDPTLLIVSQGLVASSILQWAGSLIHHSGHHRSTDRLLSGAPRRPTGSSNSTRTSHSLLHPPTLPAPH